MLPSSLWVGLWQHLVARGEHTHEYTWPALHTHSHTHSPGSVAAAVSHQCSLPLAVELQSAAEHTCKNKQPRNAWLFLLAATDVSFSPFTLRMNNTGTTDASSEHHGTHRCCSWIFMNGKHGRKKIAFVPYFAPMCTFHWLICFLENLLWLPLLWGCLVVEFVVLISWQISLSGARVDPSISVQFMGQYVWNVKHCPTLLAVSDSISNRGTSAPRTPSAVWRENDYRHYPLLMCQSKASSCSYSN